MKFFHCNPYRSVTTRTPSAPVPPAMTNSWLFVMLAVAATKEMEHCEDSSSSTFFLQTQQMLRQRTSTECGYLVNGSLGDALTFNNNNCKYHIHGNDCHRPIPDVMAEHPGVDGFCYFNAVAMYIYYSPPSSDPDQYVKSAWSGVTGLRLTGAYHGLNSGPSVVYHFEGKEIHDHIDVEHYIYDDIYGYSLGVLQGQGRTLEQLRNPAVWEELTRENCKEIQDTYQFTKDELVLEDILDMNMPILAMSHCAGGLALPFPMSSVSYVTEKAEYVSPSDCKAITPKEFARHHYMKCLLSIRHAAHDTAYLFARACLRHENGTASIGHFSQCPFDLEAAAGHF